MVVNVWLKYPIYVMQITKQLQNVSRQLVLRHLAWKFIYPNCVIHTVDSHGCHTYNIYISRVTNFFYTQIAMKDNVFMLKALFWGIF